MRKTGWIVTAAVAALAAAGGAVPAFAYDVAPLAAPATTNVVKHQTLCPVMGNEVNKTLFVDYQGKRVYVCCMGCLADVKKNPAKYINKLEAQGITLDKTPQAATTNAPAATGQ